MFQNKIVLPVFAVLLIGLFVPAVSGLSMIVFLLGIWAQNRFKLSVRGALQNPFTRYQILFWLLVICSLLWSSNLEKAWQEVGRLSTFIVFPLFMYGRGEILKQHLNGFWKLLWIAGLAISLVCIGSVVWRSNGTGFLNQMVYENLAYASGLQPIYLSLFLIIGLIAWFADQLYNKKLLWWKSLLPLFFFVMVIMLSSRTELLVCLVVWLGIFAHYAISSKKYIAAILGMLVVIGIAFLGINANTMNAARFEEMVNFEQDYTQNQWGGRSLRIEKWRNTWELYIENPVLGTGIGDYFDELMETYQKNDFEIAYQFKFNSHNQYLQTLCSLGILGIFLLLTILLSWLYVAFKAHDWPSVLVLIAIGLSMLTESMLERQTGLFLFGALGNWLVLASKPSKKINKQIIT